MRILQKQWGVVLIGLIVTSLSLPVASGPAYSKGAPKVSEEAEQAAKAAQVLSVMTAGEDSRIPEYMLERAYAIAVIPNVIKGAFVVGGHFGKGLVAERRPNGEWSSPAYVAVGGASYGFQVGVESTDLVLVFTSPDGLKGLLQDKVKLGADATIAAGPIGRDAQAGTNLTLDSAIYSYSRSKGVFAGVSLEGAVLESDKSANKAVYGNSATMRGILNGKPVMRPQTKPFLDALKANVPALVKQS